MKMIISPAKTFNKELIHSEQEPYFIKDAKKLMKALKHVDKDQLKRSMKLSDALLHEVTSFMKQFGKQSFKAIYAYYGQAFKKFDVNTLSDDEINYMNEHLLILSGLYGILKPDDGISLYRLEMQDQTIQNLYHFWKPKINKYFKTFLKDELIIDLTSEEYQKVLPELHNIVHIDFLEIKDHQEKRISMTMKSLRGLFARKVIQEHIEDLDRLKTIEIDGFLYDPVRSDEKHMIYVKEVK